MDVGRARIARSGDGSVVFDDPDSALVVRVWPRTGPRGPYVARLRVDARDPAVAITATRLRALPVAQMLHLAAGERAGDLSHANETLYRMLAAPKRPGQRSWGPDHYERVLTVYEWAVQTGRPGGGAQAVAELWGVAVNPTVYRWLARARRDNG
jgi:hypothetical protein